MKVTRVQVDNVIRWFEKLQIQPVNLAPRHLTVHQRNRRILRVCTLQDQPCCTTIFARGIYRLCLSYTVLFSNYLYATCIAKIVKMSLCELKFCSAAGLRYLLLDLRRTAE